MRKRINAEDTEVAEGGSREWVLFWHLNLLKVCLVGAFGASIAILWSGMRPSCRQCLVLVGGLGTRMSGLSEGLPKALLPVGPRTFIEWQLEWLARCGISEVVLALGHQGDLIRTHIESSICRQKNLQSFPRIYYSFDGESLLGTGGAIVKAAPLLEDNFLVTYGDSFLFLSAESLFQEHRRQQKAVTFSIFRNDNRFDKSNVEYRDGTLYRYSKKNQTPAMHHIDYGMFALRKSDFLAAAQSDSFDIADYLSQATESGEVAAFIAEKRFYEVGSPEGYRVFCDFMKSTDYDLEECHAEFVKSDRPFNGADLLQPNSRKVLIIIPGTVSYFYDVEGLRFGRVLKRLGANVEVCTLAECPKQESYDWALFFNLSEIQLAFGASQEEFYKSLKEVSQRAASTALVLMESLRVGWFEENFQIFQRAGLDILLDVGFIDQHLFCSQAAAEFYSFVFNGLTEDEKSRAQVHFTPPSERPLPWTFIGHRTRERIEFVGELTQKFGPQGFLYLPEFTPITKDGPHLNEEQFERVLRSTQIKIWCSHVPNFYIESIRFRYALLNGALPIKVNYHPRDVEVVPFDNLILEAETFADRLRDMDFVRTRAKFAEEFTQLPSFEDSLKASVLFQSSRTFPGRPFQGIVQ